ncbi:MAG: glycosyltransferase family 2 protein [Calditrichaeota bacterium]|nr:MAG: glycosyltransferase family 2 protein [Calditrichota bacterium]
MKVVVLIPAFNEERSIEKVLKEIPRKHVSEVVVIDNNSTDRTAEIAKRNGAIVLKEPNRGYGSACLTGIKFAQSLNPDVLVFLDADYSDFPEEMSKLLEKISQGYDMVIGSRMLGKAAPGSLLPQARWGNRLAVFLIRLFFGYRYTDLGPFRAIRWQALQKLHMQDRNFGWTVEMQIKAVKLGLKITEVSVGYRNRIGTSKITGTVSGTLKAGYKILFTIFKYALK